MKKYIVRGMSCAACTARVEKAVSAVPGVTTCTVNLLTASMIVEGQFSENSVISAVRAAGYDVVIDGKNPEDGIQKDKVYETRPLKIRIISSLFFLIPLMYISMGYTMWNWPLPNFLSKNFMAIGILQFILTAIVMVINQKFFISGFRALFKHAPNMDSLVALGSAVAFIYSTYALFAMSAQYAYGNILAAKHFLHEFYFESAAMILTLITVGKLLEAVSKGKATDAVASLVNLAPKTANVIRDDFELTVDIGQLMRGDIIIVRPGESFPADGKVIEGTSAVDEAALTGESVPVDKKSGDSVFCATINKSGTLRCEVTEVGEESTLSRIIKMVSDAAATKAPIARLADKISGIFVPTVILIAVATIAIWLISGQTVGYALARGISVLVISCPCALGLATPVAVMVGSGIAAKHGILFKTAASLEQTGKTAIAVFDKTGTITSGLPVVTDIIPTQSCSKEELLEMAASLENESSHPLAKAISQKAEELSVNISRVSDFKEHSGQGVSAMLNDNKLFAGRLTTVSEMSDISNEFVSKAETLSDEGKTPLFFLKNDILCGIIAVADTVREDSASAISRLQVLGIRTVMLTGDNKKTATAIGKKAKINEIISDVLPDEKAKAIESLKNEGAVTMVGDGINDAPALTTADIGIAIGAGTDIAIDAADVVVMKSRLSDVVNAIRLSRATLRNIRQNLFWAFIYNIIGIPLAAGVFIPILGWQLNPMFGAAAMSLSSFCVVTNALRLNFFKAEKEENINYQEKIKEEIFMQRTIKIEGMMCAHCSGRVKSALEGLSQVSNANVSHETASAVVMLSDNISDELLKETVETQGYKVTEIS